MIEELEYKMEAVLKYLKKYGGYDYKLYNRLCPKKGISPDSNIVEYMEDIISIIDTILECTNLKN